MSAKKALRRTMFALLGLASFWASRGGLPAVQRWGHALGIWHHRCRRARNQLLLTQIGRVFPEHSPEQCAAVLRTAYAVNDRAIFEVVSAYRGHLDAATLAGAVQIEDLTPLHQALQRGQGVVLLAPHMGNALAMAVALSVAGVPVHVVYRESSKMPRHFFRDGITGLGLQAINAGTPTAALRGMLQALRHNHVVFVMLDQAAKKQGEALSFLDKTLFIPSGPLQAAHKTGASLCMAQLTAVEPQWGYQLAELGPAAPGQSVRAHLAELMHIMDRQIRAHPHWWSWHQRRWWRYAFNTPSPRREYG